MITPGLLSLAILLFAFSAFGWGRLAGIIGAASIRRIHSLTVVLGLGVLHVLGGLLNLAGIATRPVLMALMLIGAIIAGVELCRRQPWKNDLRLLRKSHRSTTGLFLSFLPLLIALIATSAAFSLLVPTTVFNSGDDFHTYVTRVIRMVQTGSLAGTPFDMQGLDGQGSQSFFQAFFTDGTRITALNSFDAVFCFGLALCLIAEASLRWRVPPALGVLAVSAIVIINPQYVNISPLYSGALFIIALLVSSAAIIRKLGATPPRHRWQNELTLALIAAPLFTLKVPLALFAGLFLLGLFLFLNLTQSNRKQLIKPAFVILGALALFVVPWVLTHLPTLLHARALGTNLAAKASLASAYGSMAAGDVAKLLTNTRSTYGDTFLAFDFLVLACIALGTTAAWLLLRQPPKTPALLVAATIGVTIPLAYFLNAFLFPVETAVRYSSPMLIAALAAGLICLARPTNRPAPATSKLIWANACLILIALVWFLPTFQSRLAVARKYHTLVSYEISDGYAQYSTTLASPEQSGFYRALQKGTRPGDPILAWTIAPFHLDFARNPILTISEQGLTNPQILFPAGADPASLEAYLRKLGVRYLMVETGAGTAKDSAYLRTVATSQDIMFRKLGDYCLYFRESLFAMSKHHNILFQNDRLLLFELKDPPSP